MINLYKTFTEPDYALISELTFTLKMVHLFTVNKLSTYILEFDYFSIKTFCDCSLAVTSTNHVYITFPKSYVYWSG